MKIIIGLGNPGEKYSKVRHNLGFMVLDALVDSWEDNKKLKSLIAKKDDLILAKPLTYMNNSGLAVKLLTSYYHLVPSDLIIIHDDLDLPLGKIKVRLGGAAAGHHGVESIISALGTDQFTRVRLGIGNQKSHSGEHHRVHFNADSFVMDSFEPNEKSKVKHMIKQAIEVLTNIL